MALATAGLVQRRFAYLAAKGALRPVDGVTFEHRHNVRRDWWSASWHAADGLLARIDPKGLGRGTPR
jgi:hypothetical protein